MKLYCLDTENLRTTCDAGVSIPFFNQIAPEVKMSMRSLTVILILSICVLPGFSMAATTQSIEHSPSSAVFVSVLNDDLSGIQVSAAVPEIAIDELEPDAEYAHLFEMQGEAYTARSGWPELPVVARTVLVSPTAHIRLEVNEVEFTIEHGYSPALVPEVSDGQFVMDGGPDSEFLLHDGFYPPHAVSISEPAILRGYRLVSVNLYPVQYNPVTGETKLNRNFDFNIVYDDGEAVNPVLRPGRIPPSRYVKRILRNTLLNPPEELNRDDALSGSYLYIVPEVNGLDEILEPLIEWRKRQGHDVVVVHLPNNANAGRIGNAIDEAYEEWENPVEFVALVGDASGGSYNLAAASANGDYNYTRVDGNDPLPDIALGRISVNSANQLRDAVNKLVTYETDPYMEDPDWFRQGAVVAGYVRNGLSTVLVAKYVRKILLDHGYEEVRGWYHNVDGEIPRGQVQPFVNQVFEWGISALLYRAYQYMNGLPLNQIDNLPNDEGRWPMVVAISCNTGDFVNPNAQNHTERIFRADGGGIAAIGTATAGTSVSYNNVMAGGTWKGIYKLGLHCPGWGLNTGKYELWRAYDGFDFNYQNFMDWNNLIGDPGTHLWTGTPQIITVEHKRDLAIGESRFEVTVSDENGEAPVPDALVCLYKGDELHVTAMTDEDGFAVFFLPVDDLAVGEMMVTVTKHNVFPYRGGAEIAEQELYLGAESWNVNDEEGGDGNGVANPGETITLEVSLMNFGTAVPEGRITIAAESMSPFAEVVSDPVELEESPGEGESEIISFSVEMDASAVDEAIVLVNLETVCGENRWNSIAAFEVEAPRVAVSGLQFENEALARGQIQYLDIELSNIGRRPLNPFAATIIGASDIVMPRVERARYNRIEPGNRSRVEGDLFRVQAHVYAIPGMEVSMQLAIETDDGFRDTSSFSINLVDPEQGEPFGPDSYGYVCFDSDDVDWEMAPVYEWVEIDPGEDEDFIGTNLDLRDAGDNGDQSTVVALPFNFQYYGEAFLELTICTNGWAAFGNQRDLLDFRNTHIGQALGPDAQLCVFWDNLMTTSNGGDAGEVYTYYDEDGGKFIIEWSRMHRLEGRNIVGAEETFELILLDTRLHPTYSGDGIILFQYKDITNGATPAYRDPPFATVGISNLDDSDGLEYTYWDTYHEGAKELEDEMALKFTTAVEFITGVLSGNVTSLSSGEPIAGAQITTSRGFWGETDENGFYAIDDILIGDGYIVTVSMEAFNDSINANAGEGFSIVEDETTTVDFALLHPEFNIDTDGYHFQMNADDTLDVSFNLSNDGSGTLVYTSKFTYLLDDGGDSLSGGSGDPFRDDADELWDTLLVWHAGDSVQDTKLQGVVFIDDYWLVSGGFNGRPEENWFYKFDRWGNFTDSFQQPVVDSRYGIRDMCYHTDGYLYGVVSDQEEVLRIDPETGEELARWSATQNCMLSTPGAMTIDPEGYFWVSSPVSNVYKFELVDDTSLVEVGNYRTFDPRQPDARIRINGLAWFRDDPDGYNLYIMASNVAFAEDDPEGDLPEVSLYKLNPATGDILFQTNMPQLDSDDRGRGGISINAKWNNLVWSIAAVLDNSNGDRVAVIDLAPNSSWLTYSPRTDTLFALQTIPIGVNINTTGLDLGDYWVTIEFSHNAQGRITEVPVMLLITDLAAPGDEFIPFEYTLEQNFPNPFNPLTAIHYYLKQAGMTKLRVFDVTGREVVELVHEEQAMGSYTFTFDGRNFPAGIYFYSIEAGDFKAVRKMLLLK